MRRENLRDHLPGARKRKADTPPTYQSDHCELKACRCGNRGAPDIAIQDRAGNVVGYVCQLGYKAHIDSRGLDQFSQWKPSGTVIATPAKPDIAAGLRHIADAFDAFADSYAARDDDHDRDA